MLHPWALLKIVHRSFLDTDQTLFIKDYSETMLDTTASSNADAVRLVIVNFSQFEMVSYCQSLIQFAIVCSKKMAFGVQLLPQFLNKYLLKTGF